MAYASLADLRNYLFAGGTTAPATDDALLTAMLARAQAMVDTHTGRVFEAVSTTKRYDLPADENLFVDDLLTVTTLTNGDGQVIPNTEYLLLPTNKSPKRFIYLKPASGYTWNVDADGNATQVISVTGTWGFSATAPVTIQQATIRLAAWLYRQKDTSGDLDRPLLAGDGAVIMPSAMPKDVEQMLAPYARRFIA